MTEVRNGGVAAPRRAARVQAKVRRRLASIAGLRAWKLEDAKAKFSEVVRRARREGPQRVTYRGEDAVVVIAVEDYERLLPAAGRRQTLSAFLRATALGDIDVRRAPDRGRDQVL